MTFNYAGSLLLMVLFSLPPQAAFPADPKCGDHINNTTNLAIHTVELRNGTIAPLSLVTAVSFSVDLLVVADPITANELFQKAQDPNYKLQSNSEKSLIELKLLNTNGTMNSLVRDIILSSIVTNDSKISYIPPVALMPQ